MRQRYRTIKNFGEARVEINKSVFLIFTDRAETGDEAESFVARIRKNQRDATHNCFAYICGERDEYQKAGDDGEPSGTAGKPILEVIKRSNLKDTAVVVSRYYGGVKLGAGGLIRAYGNSASAGIAAAGVIERTLHTRLGIEIAYNQLGLIENQLTGHGYYITARQFDRAITLAVLVQPAQEKSLKELVNQLSAGTALFTDQGLEYLDRDIKGASE